MPAILAVTRRLEFPGKRRLRLRVRLPTSGVHDVTLLGARFRLDLSESLHRDYHFGLCDRVELRLIRRFLSRGGDFVDVGAHIGLYTVLIARQIPGRVLALEPNPRARAMLKVNVELNRCLNVTVEGVAASNESGYQVLHLPEHGDSSWATLDEDRVDDTTAVDIETVTLDAEVDRASLRPAIVKIDVEGHEFDVLRGAERVLARRPALLVELVEQNAAVIIGALAQLGYLVARVGTRGLVPWTGVVPAANAVFVQPWQLRLLRRHDRRAFSHTQEDVVASSEEQVRKSIERAADLERV